MTRRQRIVIGLVLATAAVDAVGVAGAATSDVASYTIDVVLHEDEGRLEASQRIEWVNTADIAATELRFHLYLNAFAHPETTFMRRYDRRRPVSTVRRWGWIRITSLETVDGTDLLAGLEFVRPDDGNPADFTVARVPLSDPVLPGETLELTGSFEALLPEIIERTGVTDRFHLVGQWFPKLGVFEGAAGWRCHQFHLTTEFYADFGSYRVALDVPRGWVVAATGTERRRSERGDRQRVEFEADRVHDFVWSTAPPDLMAEVEFEFEPHRDVPAPWLADAVERLDRSSADLELAPVAVRLVVPRDQLWMASRMELAARLSIAWTGLRLGPYPYRTLTIVSPPPGAGGAGGMEYATFFTTGAVPLDGVMPLAWGAGIEGVTAHEHAHQYIPGLVSTDESEQAWIDEGLASLLGHQAVESMARLGAFGRFDRLGLNRWLTALLIRGFAPPLVTDQPSWAFRTSHDYARAAYAQAGFRFATLERMVGEGAFARGLRLFVERYRFRRAGSAELEATLSEAAGRDLGSFFEQLFESTAIPEWAVLDVEPPRERPQVGFGWRDGGWHAAEGLPPADDSDERGGWTVDLGRRSRFVGPLEVEIAYADGERERHQWDGATPWVRWRLPAGRRPVEVTADPDRVWLLERRLEDNTWRAHADPSEARRRAWWLYALIHACGGLFG